MLSPVSLTSAEYARISKGRRYRLEDYDQRVRDRWLEVVGKPL